MTREQQLETALREFVDCARRNAERRGIGNLRQYAEDRRGHDHADVRREAETLLNAMNILEIEE